VDALFLKLNEMAMAEHTENNNASQKTPGSSLGLDFLLRIKIIFGT
jgi:hypothetical protein